MEAGRDYTAIKVNGVRTIISYEERERREREFADLPTRLRNVLVGNGYRTRQEVAHTSDERLSWGHGISMRTVEQIRRNIPYMEHNVKICPSCQGTGVISPEQEVT